MLTPRTLYLNHAALAEGYPQDLVDELQPSPLKTDEIIAEAERLAQHYDYQFNCDSLRSVVKRMRGDFGSANGDPWEGTMPFSMAITSDGGFFIGLPPRARIDQNITEVACNLGHLHLHFLKAGLQGKGQHALFPRHTSKKMLQQAITFGYNFLAPKAKIQDIILSGYSELGEIGDKLSVSRFVVYTQMKRFDLGRTACPA